MSAASSHLCLFFYISFTLSFSFFFSLSFLSLNRPVFVPAYHSHTLTHIHLTCSRFLFFQLMVASPRGVGGPLVASHVTTVFEPAREPALPLNLNMAAEIVRNRVTLNTCARVKWSHAQVSNSRVKSSSVCNHKKITKTDNFVQLPNVLFMPSGRMPK